MKLTNITIKNFKSLENISLRLNKNKTLIIGKNNVGKSNLLEIIGLMLNLGSSSYDIPSFNKYLNREECYFSTIKPIEVELVFSLVSEKDSYPENIKNYIEEVNGRQIIRLTLFKELGEKGLFYIGETTLTNPEYVKIAKFIYFNGLILGTTRNYTNGMKEGNSPVYSLVLRSIIRYVAKNKLNEINNYLTLNEEEFDKYFCDLMSKFLREEIFINRAILDFKEVYFKAESNLKKFVQALISSDFNIENTEPILKNLAVIINDGRSQSLNLKGMGVQSMFFINLILRANVLFQFKPIICIDEAELHLHPQAQRRFNEILSQLSEINQIIITTHSPIFIKPSDLWSVVLLKKNESTMSYQLPIDAGLDKNVIIRELDEFNSEMLFADAVLLVEGVSEKIIFRHIANNCLEQEYNLDKNNVSIIPVGGKANMQFYSSLLKSFEIPHLILLDLDGINETCTSILSQRNIKLDCSICEKEKINLLKKDHDIFVLSKGDIEDYYPEEIIKLKYKDKKNVDLLLNKKERDVIEGSNIKIVEDILLNNLPILAPQSEADRNMLDKNIKKWYNSSINRLRSEGVIYSKIKKKKYEILESIFGSIGKPRMAIEITKMLPTIQNIDEELLEVVKKVIKISKPQ